MQKFRGMEIQRDYLFGTIKGLRKEVRKWQEEAEGRGIGSRRSQGFKLPWMRSVFATPSASAPPPPPPHCETGQKIQVTDKELVEDAWGYQAAGA